MMKFCDLPSLRPIGTVPFLLPFDEPYDMIYRSSIKQSQVTFFCMENSL